MGQPVQQGRFVCLVFHYGLVSKINELKVKAVFKVTRRLAVLFVKALKPLPNFVPR
jgi:hypothetical protein